MTHIPEGNYLSLFEAAELAKVSRITVQKWIEAGHLPAINIPRLGRIIAESEFTAFLQKERPRGYPRGRPRK